MSKPEIPRVDLPEDALHPLDRHAQAIPGYNMRWLWGVAIAAPLALSAGVYMLHWMPGGALSNDGRAVMEVRLVEPAPEPQQEQVANPQFTTGYTEPLIEAPNRTIPEEAATVVPEPAQQAALPRASDGGKMSPVTRPSAGAVAAQANFQSRLYAHIARYQRYPAAVRSGQHGTVKLVFSMRRDGTVAELRVQTSSGFPALDEAATDTVRRAQPLPAIPVDLPDKLTILFPIAFEAPKL